MKNIANESRIWELDLLRGIALVLMIYFHVLFDMREIYGYNVNYSSGLNYLAGKTSAILFIAISGISCYLSRNNVIRGVKVLGFAMLITLISWYYSPDLVIKFGILHFLGCCIMLSPFFKRIAPYWLVEMGTAVIFLGGYLNRIKAANDYFFILGICSGKFVSSDYYPLFPWLGVFLYGLSAGKLFYRSKKSVFGFTIGNNVVSRMGKHSLFYYLIHQPLILGLLAVASRI